MKCVVRYTHGIKGRMSDNSSYFLALLILLGGEGRGGAQAPSAEPISRLPPHDLHPFSCANPIRNQLHNHSAFRTSAQVL